MMDFQAMFEDTTRYTGCNIFGAMKCYQSHSPEKIFPARFVLLANHTCWDRGLSLLFFAMVSQYTNIYIYACLYVFCLSACVRWESINLKLNTPGHYLQSRKTPASWNHEATQHPHSRRVTTLSSPKMDQLHRFSMIFPHISTSP